MLGNRGQANGRDIAQAAAQGQKAHQRERNQHQLQAPVGAELVVHEVAQKGRQDPLGRAQRHHAEQRPEENGAVGTEIAEQAEVQLRAVGRGIHHATMPKALRLCIPQGIRQPRRERRANDE